MASGRKQGRTTNRARVPHRRCCCPVSSGCNVAKTARQSPRAIRRIERQNPFWLESVQNINSRNSPDEYLPIKLWMIMFTSLWVHCIQALYWGLPAGWLGPSDVVVSRLEGSTVNNYQTLRFRKLIKVFQCFANVQDQANLYVNK